MRLLLLRLVNVVVDIGEDVESGGDDAELVDGFAVCSGCGGWQIRAEVVYAGEFPVDGGGGVIGQCVAEYGVGAPGVFGNEEPAGGFLVCLGEGGDEGLNGLQVGVGSDVCVLPYFVGHLQEGTVFGHLVAIAEWCVGIVVCGGVGLRVDVGRPGVDDCFQGDCGGRGVVEVSLSAADADGVGMARQAQGQQAGYLFGEVFDRPVREHGGEVIEAAYVEDVDVPEPVVLGDVGGDLEAAGREHALKHVEEAGVTAYRCLPDFHSYVADGVGGRVGGSDVEVVFELEFVVQVGEAAPLRITVEGVGDVVVCDLSRQVRVAEAVFVLFQVAARFGQGSPAVRVYVGGGIAPRARASEWEGVDVRVALVGIGGCQGGQCGQCAAQLDSGFGFADLRHGGRAGQCDGRCYEVELKRLYRLAGIGAVNGSEDVLVFGASTERERYVEGVVFGGGVNGVFARQADGGSACDDGGSVVKEKL